MKHMTLKVWIHHQKLWITWSHIISEHQKICLIQRETDRQISPIPRKPAHKLYFRHSSSSYIAWSSLQHIPEERKKERRKYLIINRRQRTKQTSMNHQYEPDSYIYRFTFSFFRELPYLHLPSAEVNELANPDGRVGILVWVLSLLAKNEEEDSSMLLFPS